MDYRAWKYEAVQMVRRYATVYPQTAFICREIREFATRHCLVSPPDPRWWGAVMQEAADIGIIRFSFTGIDPMRRQGACAVWYAPMCRA